MRDIAEEVPPPKNGRKPNHVQGAFARVRDALWPIGRAWPAVGAPQHPAAHLPPHFWARLGCNWAGTASELKDGGLGLDGPNADSDGIRTCVRACVVCLVAGPAGHQAHFNSLSPILWQPLCPLFTPNPTMQNLDVPGSNGHSMCSVLLASRIYRYRKPANVSIPSRTPAPGN